MKYIFSIIVLVASITLAPVPANALSANGSAIDLFPHLDCTGSSASSAVCTDQNKQRSIAGPNSIIEKIINIVSYVAGAAAIIIILLSSFRYIAASGDPKNVESAKNTLIGAIIGLAVIVLARVAVLYVVRLLASK